MCMRETGAQDEQKGHLTIFMDKRKKKKKDVMHGKVARAMSEE